MNHKFSTGENFNLAPFISHMQKDSRNNSPKRVNIDGTNLIKTKEKKKLDSEVKQLIKREFPMVNIDYDNFTDDDV